MAGSVRVTLFATAREAVGSGRIEVPVPVKGLPLAQFLEQLGERYERLVPVLRASRILANGAYAEPGRTHVRPGDEVSIHPPYSGG